MANIFLIGRLGSDPEVSYSAKGTKVTKFSAAENLYRAGQEEQTVWYNVVLFGDTSAQIVPHLKKGSLVVVNGEYRPRDWVDNSGQKRVAHDIVAHHLTFVPATNPRTEAPGSNPPQNVRSHPQATNSQVSGSSAQNTGFAPNSNFAQKPMPQQAQPSHASMMGHGVDIEEDEELPF